MMAGMTETGAADQDATASGPGTGRPAAGRSPHEWTRMVRGWHAAFWIMVGLAALWLAVTTTVSGSGRVTGLAAIGVLMLAYGALMQRPTRTTGWPAWIYLIIAVVAVGVSCSVDGALSMLLFVVYSQVWMFTPNLKVGSAFATALTVSALLGFLSKYGFTAERLREIGPQMAVSLLFSLLLGIWISRIISQSSERAELIAELDAARSGLSQAQHARGVMAERERMALEIHDTLAQGFTSIVMLAQAAAVGIEQDPDLARQRLGTIEDVARENLAEARALVAAFSPVGLENSTLPAAVGRLTERFAAETGLDIELDVDFDLSDGAPRLRRDQEVVLLRAVQEALTNVRRHAQASRIIVRLLVDADGARVEVRDDGVGFAPVLPGAPQPGYGLAGMRGRVADLGGDLDVASSPGAGTRVVVQVPAAGRPAVCEEGP
jgi:signal transduction histidine kinase